MANRGEVYKCELCGNIVEVLHGGEGELVCCGQAMSLLTENTVDAAKEKHVPVVEKVDGGVRVKVGDVAHPMEEKHYIEWIEANSEQIFIDTLGNIKQKNSDIYGIQEEDRFVQFIKDNIRKQPDEYAEIRKVNAGLLEVDDEDQEIMDLGKNECAASMYGK